MPDTKKCRAPFSSCVTEILKLRDSSHPFVFGESRGQLRSHGKKARVPVSSCLTATFTIFLLSVRTQTAANSSANLLAEPCNFLVAKWSQSQKKWDTVFCRYPIDFVVVRPAGIEPAAYCLGGNRSIRLSYERASYLVKQSDARCQVEAGGGRSCVSGAEAGCFAPPSRKNPLWGSCRVACDRFRIACAAGAAWGQVRCPWHPAPRRRPPAG